MTIPSDKPPGSAEELSKRLRARLGVKSLHEDLWAALWNEGFVQAAINPPNTRGFNDCVKEARRLIRMNPDWGPPRAGKRKRTYPRPLLPKVYMARSRYWWERHAIGARSQREILRAREVLGLDRGLTDSEAASVLMSDANRFLPPEFFKNKDIPIVGHQTSPRLPSGERPASWGPGVLLRIDWPGGHFETPYQESWWFDPPRTTISIPDRKGTHYTETVKTWSVLDVVREASVALHRWHGWKEHEATWFVLTDRILYDAPVHVWVSASESSGLARGLLTLEVAPWLPANVIRDIYQHEQEFYFKACGRPLSSHQFDLFRFVQNLLDSREDHYSWDDLRRRWNRKYRSRGYSDYRLFRKEYCRALRWVRREMVSPEYKALPIHPKIWPSDPPRVRRKPAPKRPKEVKA